MLRTTSHSITEIALSLGYPNLYAFTRAFSQYYQLTPTHYRNNDEK
ncbi:helix-turn-helix domain-containing protein [Gracilibacillus alcaliphilus]|nr:AraC-like DNA-binding protein [Gracilibacillus alcaliphilus]